MRPLITHPLLACFFFSFVFFVRHLPTSTSILPGSSSPHKFNSSRVAQYQLDNAETPRRRLSSRLQLPSNLNEWLKTFQVRITAAIASVVSRCQKAACVLLSHKKSFSSCLHFVLVCLCTCMCTVAKVKSPFCPWHTEVVHCLSYMYFGWWNVNHKDSCNKKAKHTETIVMPVVVAFIIQELLQWW